MRLVVLTCLWRRPYITSIFWLGIGRIRAHLTGRLDFQVLAVGSEGVLSREPAVQAGAHYIEHPNRPLGAKHNAGVRYAIEDLAADYLLVLDSDDLISNALAATYVDLMDQNVAYAGLRDLYFVDSTTGRALHWPGYPKKNTARHGEPAGTARLVGRSKVLALDCQLYEEEKYRGLDHSMHLRLACQAVLVKLADDRVALDIKGRDNIWPFHGTGQLVEFETLAPAFGADEMTRLRRQWT